MTGLKEGEEYQFRVMAVNDIGNSEPSRPSASILVEEQPNKPCMDLGGVRDITVRAGEDFSIHVPFMGFPPPTASWFKDDTILDDTDSRIHRQVLSLLECCLFTRSSIFEIQKSLKETLSNLDFISLSSLYQ